MTWSWANIDWNGTGAMVQAIGSVAAIVGAAQLATKGQLDRRAEAMEAFHGIVVEVQQTVAIAAEMAEALVSEPPTLLTPMTERFDDLEALIKSVPVFELGASNGARMIASLLHQVRSMRTRLSAPGPNPHLGWIAWIRDYKEQTDLLEAEVRGWREAREHRARRWLLPQGRA